MIKHIKYNKLAYINHGWLKTRHHFSFASYYDPQNMGYGNIRVINDDIIEGNTGFPPHPHNDMEIITYVLEGQLTHSDSIGNEKILGRGDVQYMSAGTGVTHSEANNSNEPLRLFQIWIYPEKKGLKPNYGDLSIEPQQRENKLLHLVSHYSENGLIKIYQKTDIFLTELKNSNELSLELEGKKGFYVINMEGESKINQIQLGYGDALIIEENIKIQTDNYAHLLILRT